MLKIMQMDFCLLCYYSSIFLLIHI
uniref:Uncharacterized protein n=1 Tax=Rhizophora mucronata TaxID=61149 RepID=A0A2P2PZR9_RHIMU